MKVRQEIYFIEKVKIRYCWWLFFIENAERVYGCDFNLSKMLKEDAARNLLHLKCWNMVRLDTWDMIQN